MKKESMQISFDGQSHQIDANTLVNMLIHYGAIIQQANSELSGGSRNVQVNINAFKEGSFVVDICLTESLKSIFSTDTVVYLAGLVTTVEGVFKLYKRFKGKPIDEKDSPNISVDVKGNNVTIKNVVNIYNDRVVRSAISKSIETANEDISVEGITISGSDSNPITFSRNEFPDLIYTDFDSEADLPDEIEEDVDATLVIVGLKFEKKGKWEFIYNGFKISMIVKDDALMREIDNGARFGKGDAIEVKMKIIKKFNPEYGVYENKSYKILEFYKHIIYKKPSQANMF